MTQFERGFSRGVLGTIQTLAASWTENARYSRISGRELVENEMWRLGKLTGRTGPRRSSFRYPRVSSTIRRSSGPPTRRPFVRWIEHRCVHARPTEIATTSSVAPLVISLFRRESTR
jgi:hypothetical protein